MNYFKKRREKKILVDYLNHLQNPKVPFPDWYLMVHRNKIEWIEWLIGYYEGKTASTPKELLEEILCPIRKLPEYNLEAEIESIKFLYHWVYYKQITGF